jgi:hypothetical protein
MGAKIIAVAAALLLTVLMLCSGTADATTIEVSSGFVSVVRVGTWDLSTTLDAPGFHLFASVAGFDLAGFFNSLATNQTNTSWGPDVFLNGTFYLAEPLGPFRGLSLSLIHDPIDLFFNPVPGIPLFTCGVIRPCDVSGFFTASGSLQLFAGFQLDLIGRGIVSAHWREDDATYSVGFVFLPEPSTLLLLAVGGVGLAFTRARRRSQEK